MSITKMETKRNMRKYTTRIKPVFLQKNSPQKGNKREFGFPPFGGENLIWFFGQAISLFKTQPGYARLFFAALAFHYQSCIDACALFKVR